MPHNQLNTFQNHPLTPMPPYSPHLHLHPPRERKISVTVRLDPEVVRRIHRLATMTPRNNRTGGPLWPNGELTQSEIIRDAITAGLDFLTTEPLNPR